MTAPYGKCEGSESKDARYQAKRAETRARASDVISEFDRARDRLLSKGVALRASDWLSELEENR